MLAARKAQDTPGGSRGRPGPPVAHIHAPGLADCHFDSGPSRWPLQLAPHAQMKGLAQLHRETDGPGESWVYAVGHPERGEAPQWMLAVGRAERGETHTAGVPQSIALNSRRRTPLMVCA